MVDNPRPKVKDAVSAGGVVWRAVESGEIEVVLCGRGADSLWVLPKGTPDPGETIEETALREVREETGLVVKTGARLPTIEYWFVANGARYHKFVHHWLMEPIGGDLADHDAEFDTVRWVSIDEAPAMLTYSNERRVLADASRVLAGSA
jgi:8-oxo-dGTP pyrophosphatase MutT (NUDIX family)